jgi:hypothetical protein
MNKMYTIFTMYFLTVFVYNIYMSETNVSAGEQLLSARQVSELFPSIGSPATIRRWAREGKIPHVKLPGGRRLFRRADFEQMLIQAPDGVEGI